MSSALNLFAQDINRVFYVLRRPAQFFSLDPRPIPMSEPTLKERLQRQHDTRERLLRVAYSDAAARERRLAFRAGVDAYAHSQRHLARALGVSLGYITDRLSGRRAVRGLDLLGLHALMEHPPGQEADDAQ